jgi:hypothetical protein
MLTLTLKNLPRELHAMLKESAEKNRRSLNSEILVRLERDLAAPTVDPERHAKELKALARLPRVDIAGRPYNGKAGRFVVDATSSPIAG